MLKRLVIRDVLKAVGAALVAQVAAACEPVDYLNIPISGRQEDPIQTALTLAYPDIRFLPDGSSWSVNEGTWRPMGSIDVGSPEDTLRAAEVVDQFRYIYPLDFDLKERTVAWHDPGRPRNTAFFAALYGGDDETVRASLVSVAEPRLDDVSFRVTSRRGVACQLSAALTSIASVPPAQGKDHREAFRGTGGGFVWRVIAGTDRLSAHSYGIAVDLNPELGQYWRWTGAPAGRVGPYRNRIPELIVREMERRGFVWGGKWHHFDGMHFEFRPELILHARILDLS